MQIFTRSSIIPFDKKEQVELQFKKLNKRAQKIGLPSFSYTYGDPFMEERTILVQNEDFPEDKPYEKRVKETK